MREIKFRAWDKINKKWLDKDQFKINSDGTVSTYGVYSHVILVQFTGLKDKNDSEIYEGDILRNPLFPEINDMQVVFFNAGFGLVSVTEKDWQRYARILQPDFFLHKGSKIIGNIYENPELLKGKSNV